MSHTSSDDAGVLVSWLAYNNDPYQELPDGRRIPGPTLCFLFDEASPYRGKVQDAIFFLRQSVDEGERKRDREPRIFRAVRESIHDQAPHIELHQRTWTSDDPTDFEGLYVFLREALPELRRQFDGRPLYVHLSPGTPAMQTMWVLMVETGMLQEPVTMVKTLRPAQRRGRAAAVPVQLDLDTLFKTFHRSRPVEPLPEEEQVFWDPTRFQSEELKALYHQAKRLAQLQVPLLILGERGTGKTTLASWVRLNSPFRREELDGAWPSVACGQYRGETMRAELFGYKKGAYTGADQDRDGLLKRAHNDTLFLDEVGDITGDVQRLLIRALEEGAFLPLGASSPEESNFRLLTATNRPWTEVKERLDADFLDRISLFTLRLPPLREIPEDLPWLWETVFTEARRRSGRPEVPPLSEVHERKLVEHLQQHPLPGNLRDLFRVAYRLIAAGVDVDGSGSFLSAGERLAFALDTGLQPTEDNQDDNARKVAEAFARNENMDTLVADDRPLSLETVQGAFRRYLGKELLRIAREREQDVGSLCDRAERTLYNWTQR